MVKAKAKKFKGKSSNRPLALIIFIVCFALIGVYLLIKSHANSCDVSGTSGSSSTSGSQCTYTSGSGSGSPARVKLSVTGLKGGKVLFRSNAGLGDCGYGVNVNNNGNRFCATKPRKVHGETVYSDLPAGKITYPLYIRVGSKTYTAYEVCSGVADPYGGRGGCSNAENGNTPNGMIDFGGDKANDDSYVFISVAYR